MANTKISALTANTNPTWSEELVYAYNNANGKMTLNTMKTFAVSWKQDTLVSWTNIKTINNVSLLWSWNISISGWGSNVIHVDSDSDTSWLQSVLDSFLWWWCPIIELGTVNTYKSWFYLTGEGNWVVNFWSIQIIGASLNIRKLTISYSWTTVSSAAITQYTVTPSS